MPKLRPKWSDPLWLRDTTYRFVNVGDGPAFDVVITSRGEDLRGFGMPSATVAETHISIVRPREHVDVTFEVRTDGFPERPANLDPRREGWPPIAVGLTIAWNDVRGWKPRPDKKDVWIAAEHFGFARGHYAGKSLPPNRMPTSKGGQGGALSEFVQFERVLNTWIASTDQLRQSLVKWETDPDRGKRLFSNELGAQTTALGELRRDIDGLALAVFVSLTMLHEHSKRVLVHCDAASRQHFRRARDDLRRRFPIAAHTGTIRNYIAHQGLLDWTVSHTLYTDSITIEINLNPNLDWARTRDRKRTEVENIMFTEFLKRYEQPAGSPTIPLREAIDSLVEANHAPMLYLYRAALTAIEPRVWR